MTHREQLAILALLVILAILAFFFWPAPAASDTPVVASAVPAGEFEVISPLNMAPAATLISESISPAASFPATATPPAPRPVSVAPVRVPTAAVTGISSWYCGHDSACTRGYPAAGMYAAAGPALRVGDWRGRVVTVTAGGRQVAVKLVDVCACTGGRVLDLYSSAFARLAPLSRGTIAVTVRW